MQSAAKPFYKWTSKEIVENFKSLDQKTKIRLGVISAGSLFFLVLIAWPAWIVRPQLRSQIGALRIQNQLAQTTIQQEPKILEERKLHEAVVTQTVPRLLKEGEGEQVVGILAGIAEKSQVTLVSVEPESEESDAKAKFPPPFDTKYRRFSYWVTVEGGYHSLAAFVSEIENHPKILRIAELSIASKEETPRTHLGRVLVAAFALRKQTGAGTKR